MKYISASDASEKWGVSLRQVQRLLADNRIPSAKKYGRSWMIPDDAAKPLDSRIERKLTDKSLSDDLSYIIEATSIPMPSDCPDRILDIIGEERFCLEYEGELAYLRGDFKKAIDCFIKAGKDDGAKICTCPMAISAAISLGDYHLYREIEDYLKKIVRVNQNSGVAAFAEMVNATVAVSVFAPNMAPDWLKNGDFSAFQAESKPYLLYLRAKYFQCIGKYEAMLAVAQTALTLSTSKDGITLIDIYLWMVCSVACYVLEQHDEARSYLLKAMNIALPHGFITPFAESVTALGGIMEQCLKEEFQEYYDVIVGQWQGTWRNWISFHNQFTKDNITHILSLREYHMAVLVARRVPYAKIAKQYGISVGRLKNIMLDIYGKLFISSRDELSEYVF